jgi:hypothetical protein
VTDIAKDLRGITPRGMARNAMSAQFDKPQSGTMKDQRLTSGHLNPVFDPDAT